ncbi:DUF2283 domain-containing protein [Thermofilum sp.]|uniref:DUF2283 domain-containing protein n=1 Tax=Thermofilum sp. TaxID=1961369 RepID=UPI003169D425
MKVHYNPEADIFYIVIKEGPIKDTVEADDDIFLETPNPQLQILGLTQEFQD